MSNFCCQACGYDHCNDLGGCAACAWHPPDEKRIAALTEAFADEMSKINADHTDWLNRFEARQKRLDRVFVWSLIAIVIGACLAAAAMNHLNHQ